MIRNLVQERPRRELDYLEQVLWSFAPKVEIEVEASKFLVKTASTSAELEGALLLRSKVFREEYGISEEENRLWDLDEFDLKCDHLILVEKSSQKIVGTYRLLSSTVTDHFYSDTEFETDQLFNNAPNTPRLELGRACIDVEYRNGVTLALLWRGILCYSKEIKADLLFGCASFKTEDPLEAAALMYHFYHSDHFYRSWVVFPKEKYRMPMLREAFLSLNSGSPQLAHSIAENTTAPLMRLYLKAGAKVVSLPAYDQKFHCIDFLTILETKHLTSSFSRKFSG